MSAEDERSTPSLRRGPASAGSRDQCPTRPAARLGSRDGGPHWSAERFQVTRPRMRAEESERHTPDDSGRATLQTPAPVAQPTARDERDGRTARRLHTRCACEPTTEPKCYLSLDQQFAHSYFCLARLSARGASGTLPSGCGHRPARRGGSACHSLARDTREQQPPPPCF